MSEAYPGSSPESQAEELARRIGQMVHDLWEIEEGGERPLTLVNMHHGEDLFADRYGYPDPRITVGTAPGDNWFRARREGREYVPPAPTPESMARDVYSYEVARRKADVRWRYPSFEEIYGYPDPRAPRPEADRRRGKPSQS